jgi:transposase
MRGADAQPASLFSYVHREDRIPADHPLRVIRTLIDPMLAALSPRFEAMYSPNGRRSIAPEKLLRALLLQVLYTIRSERQLMEQLDYNLLFRWFVGLGVDDPVWVPTVFTKNRDRLLAGNIADALLHEVLRVAQAKGLLSQEHFTVDGTLLDAWASHKSFRPKDEAPPPPPSSAGGNPSVNFRGERRSNATHASTTDPDARLARKSNHGAARLSYQASVLMDNRHGLVVATHVTQPGYTAEWDAALELLSTLEPGRGAAPWGPTRATISPTSSRRSAPSTPRRT